MNKVRKGEFANREKKERDLNTELREGRWNYSFPNTISQRCPKSQM